MKLLDSWEGDAPAEPQAEGKGLRRVMLSGGGWLPQGREIVTRRDCSRRGSAGASPSLFVSHTNRFTG